MDIYERKGYDYKGGEESTKMGKKPQYIGSYDTDDDNDRG